VYVEGSAANNAIDNNFLVFSYYGEVGMGLAWIAYDFRETLESDGLQPALAKLGIEVSMEAEGKASYWRCIRIRCSGAGHVFQGELYL
jgi:hypothetical protein